MKIILAILLASVAFGKAVKSKPPSENLVCSKRELERRDCKLHSGKLEVILHHGRWHFNDGIEVAVHDLPTGDGVTWHSAKLHLPGARRLLEVSAWAAPAGEAQVQTRNWYVIEIGAKETKLLVNEIVQRRRPVLTREPAAQPETKRGTFPKRAPPPQFQYDPEERHGLKLKLGQSTWHLGERSGNL